MGCEVDRLGYPRLTGAALKVMNRGENLGNCRWVSQDNSTDRQADRVSWVSQNSSTDQRVDHFSWDNWVGNTEQKIGGSKSGC
jgi:hypothetical protein